MQDRTLGGGFGRPFPALPQAFAHGPLDEPKARALTADEAETLRALAARPARATLHVLREALAARTGKRVGIATIWREVRQRGLPSD